MLDSSSKFHAQPTSGKPFGVSVRLIADTLVATLSGELDIASVPILLDHLDPFRYRATRVVYELGGLTFCDAYGLRTLLAIFDGDPKAVSISEPSRAMRRMLEIVELTSIIEPSPVDQKRELATVTRLPID